MAVIAGRNIRVTANRSWCGIAWTNPGGRIEGRTLPELAALFARASQAEQALATLRELIHTASGLDDHRYSAEQMVKEMAESWEAESAGREKAEQALATVTAERDEAKYWLAAHKAASEALVDPVTGHGFFMLIGKGDDGADGWFYTFGGPLDSYTLCERSDDQDPHFVYFQRERYDHDRGCWIDGCEVVEPVLAPDECSVAPYCLEDVTEERDALKRERDEARAEGGAALAWQLRKAERDLDEARATNRDNLAVWEVERDALKAKLAEAERERDAARGEASIHYAVIEQYRSRLALCEKVVEAARKMLVEHDTELQETENEARLARALRALATGGSE